MGAFDHLEWTCDGAFEQLFGLGRGEFEKNFLKTQLPGGLRRGFPGGMFKLRIDWYITWCGTGSYTTTPSVLHTCISVTSKFAAEFRSKLILFQAKVGSTLIDRSNYKIMKLPNSQTHSEIAERISKAARSK